MAIIKAMLLTHDGHPLDPLWAAEFRGFFFGDGYLSIARNGKNRADRPSYSPIAQIVARADDAEILHDIEQKLGGGVYLSFPSNKRSQPTKSWRVRSRAGVSLVCDVLEGGLLPSKKLDEVHVVREFMALSEPYGPRKPGFDHEYVAAERERLWKEIKELHAYRLEPI